MTNNTQYMNETMKLSKSVTSCRASWSFLLFGGESGTFLLKIIICKKSATLLGNILEYPNTRLQEALP